jgi:hypothetical protein
MLIDLGDAEEQAKENKKKKKLQEENSELRNFKCAVIVIFDGVQ